jgi:hypothetical protein
MSDEKMDKEKQEKQGRLKSLFGMVRQSAEQTSDACGPGCGCHAEIEKPKKEPEPRKG